MTTAAQQAKDRIFLSKPVRRSDGRIMTRREYIEELHREGYKPVEETKGSVVWNRRKFNRMDWKEQEEYQRKLDKQVPAYYARKEGITIFYEITRTEFNYLKSL